MSARCASSCRAGRGWRCAGCRGRSWLLLLVQFAVVHHERAVRMRGDFGVVGDQHHGVVGVAQALEQAEDLFAGLAVERAGGFVRSEEHTSELQSLMRISYA